MTSRTPLNSHLLPLIQHAGMLAAHLPQFERLPKEEKPALYLTNSIGFMIGSANFADVSEVCSCSRPQHLPYHPHASLTRRAHRTHTHTSNNSTHLSSFTSRRILRQSTQ